MKHIDVKIIFFILFWFKLNKVGPAGIEPETPCL